MQHVLQTSKRVVSAVVAAATIAFSVGVGALSLPAQASATSAGDVIRGTSLSTVYYYGYDGLRHPFPNQATYMTWYSDFSDVSTISDTALSDITLGDNIVVRPGSYWIKIQSDPRTYAVARNGMIHWIESEDVAMDYAGSDWNQRILDVPDVYFFNYEVGASLMDATAYEGMVYEMSGDNYLVWDGEMRMLSDNAFAANNFMSRFVMDGSGIDDSALTAGADITGWVVAVSDVAQTEDGDETPVAEGDIMISEASSMPAGSSLPQGANSIEAFSFDVEAGNEDATLESVALSLTGISATTNITNVYLYEGITRLTESRTVNSATRMVTFNNLDLMVDAGDTRTLTARVEVSTTAAAADTFGFEIESMDDVVASGDVSGSFPVEGNIFSITGQDAGVVTVAKQGSVTNPTVGQQDAVAGMFKITAGTEPVDVEAITLEIDSASDHDDYRLYDGAVLLANGEAIGGDSVLFDMSDDPFFIDDGSNNIFTVTADIGGQNADSLKVYVDNAVDVVAIGRDFGFGNTATITTFDGDSCTSTSGDCSYSTLQGGEVTLVFNGPSAGDRQTDSEDQVLVNFAITSQNDVTVKDLDVIVYADDDGDNDATDAVDDSAGAAASDDDGLINSAGGNITDIKIINADTGAVILGPLELDSIVTAGDDADQTIDFTDDFTMDAGETLNLSIVVDIDDTLTTGTELAATVDVSGISMEDMNGDALTVGTDIVPNLDLIGFNHEALAADIDFTLATVPGDVSTVQGIDNVNVGAFSVTVGDGGPVTVTDFVLSIYGDDDGASDFTLGGEAGAQVESYFESCSLYDGTTRVAGPESPASSGNTVTFDDMDWDLAASAVTTLIVRCNIANVSDTDIDYFAVDINTATDVTAEDEDGDTVTSGGADLNETASDTTAPTNVVTVNAAGTLAVTAASATPSADFVMTGSSNNHVGTFRFTASSEDFNLTTLTFSEEQAEDDLSATANNNSSGYTNNISSVTITYPKADGSTGTRTASVSGNEARFSGLDMYVPTTTPKDVNVYVAVPGTDRDAGGSATSNEKIRMGFFVDTTNDDNVSAVGVGSGTTLDDDDIGVLGDDYVVTDGIHTFVVKETKPTITLSSSSPSGAAVVGRVEALRFNVAAAANEDVVLSALTFKVNASDNVNTGTNDWNACDNAADAGEMAPQDFDFYNLTVDGTGTTLDNDTDSDQNDSLTEMAAGTDSPWTLLKATGAICDSTEADVGFVRLVLPSVEIVPRGTTYTFSLYIDATGASSVADDSLRIDLPNDPIATYLTVSNASNEADVAVTDTTITVDDGTAFAAGDVIVYDADDGADADSIEEKMLIVSISTNDLTVVRGYLGTNYGLPDADSESTYEYEVTDDILRMVGSLFWKDDGATGAGSVDDWWGAYLVDNLTLNGNTLLF